MRRGVRKTLLKKASKNRVFEAFYVVCKMALFYLLAFRIGKGRNITVSSKPTPIKAK
jgi:hypothetical protein